MGTVILVLLSRPYVSGTLHSEAASRVIKTNKQQVRFLVIAVWSLLVDTHVVILVLSCTGIGVKIIVLWDVTLCNVVDKY